MTQRITNLLLIEDNPGDARLIQEMIKDAEFTDAVTVETCSQLFSGLERLALGGIDLVLLDLSLPDSHGLDTLRCVLKETAVPIVVLTGQDDLSLGVTAVHEGAQDYLFKGNISSPLLARAIHYAIERHQIEQERQELITDLEAFAHTVAHDLKAPLGPVLLAGEMLNGDIKGLSPKEINYCTQAIVTNSRKMKLIVDELLLLASVRKQEIHVHPLNMAQIFNQAQERLSYIIETHQATITLPDTWPMAIGYAPWVEEVWVNYLSNAINYGGKPPQIDLGATIQSQDKVLFWIRDNGFGISIEAQNGLFVPFTRLDQAKTQGHGLGLSIVRRIVEKLGGEVCVQSKPGMGSTFMFTLPHTLLEEG